LKSDATYPIEDAISNADIILVTGTLPTPDPYTTASIDIIGTYLLIQAVVRRLWEGAQQGPGDSTAQLPLVLDRVTDCSPTADSMLPEVIGGAAHTPLVPILSGPETEQLPRRLKQPVTGTIDARVQFTDPTAPRTTPLPTGDLDAVEQAIEREQAHPVDSGPVCWVSTGNAGRLSGTPRADATTRWARPGDPPRCRRAWGGHHRERHPEWGDSRLARGGAASGDSGGVICRRVSALLGSQFSGISDTVSWSFQQNSVILESIRKPRQLLIVLLKIRWLRTRFSE
jgi:hypothetical protein